MNNQVKRLARMLGMYSCYSPSLDFKIGQYGNAILSRYPIEEHEVRYLQSPVERRSLLKAVIRIGDRRVTVFNTHLGLTQGERKKQMAVVAAALQEAEGPALLVGDLNMRPGNSILEDIPSSFHHLRLPPQTTTLHIGGEIDYIYTNVADPDATAWTRPTESSDHDPVLADLPLS
jgi:endonuclease/exonuclease/phosphatase family metal-dependent hydrolase